MGDGFIPSDTRVFIDDEDYTNLATISYSQINFTILRPATLIDHTGIIRIFLGSNRAVCLLSSCTFQWTTSVTPYLDSVNPTVITGPATLTLSGRNLMGYGGTSATTHVSVDGSSCNITSMTNSTIVCILGDTEAGDRIIVGSIDGLFVSFFPSK